MSSDRDPSDYLQDIIDASLHAETFVAGMSFDAFVSDTKTLWATIRALEIVGEATRNIPESLRERYPAIPWRAMAGMRDKLIHAYASVDAEVVWKTVHEDVPAMRVAVASVIADMSQPDDTND